MELKDVLDIKNTLFYPTVSYPGMMLLNGKDIGIDNFILNSRFVFSKENNPSAVLEKKEISSKSTGKVNAYEEFLKKDYYIPFKNAFGSMDLAKSSPPKIVLLGGDNGRQVKYSYDYFLTLFMLEVANNPDYFDKINTLAIEDNDKTVQLIREAIRDLRKKYSELPVLMDQSPIYERAMFERDIASKRMGRDISLVEFVEKKKQTYAVMLTTLRHSKDFFDKREVNVDALISCFNYDKLCLCAAYQIINECEYFTEIENGHIPHELVYVYDYVEAVKKLRKSNPDYNETIKIRDMETDKIIQVNVDNLIERYEKYSIKNPNFEVRELTEEQIKATLIDEGYTPEELEKLNLSQTVELYRKTYILQKKRKEIEANWEILPKGEKRTIFRDNHTSSSSSSEEIDLNEFNRRVIESHNFLNDSDYMFTLVGRDKFSGYQAYVYDTGAVIFEKLPTGEKVEHNATYVMNYQNFMDLSQLSRTELIEGLSNGSIDGVKRIYHTKNMEHWTGKVKKHIAGTSYRKEVRDYIYSVLGSKEKSLDKGVK